MTQSNPYTKEAMARRYHQLCAKRDAINAEIAPLQAELDEANATAAAAQADANAIAAKIQQARGGADWIALKKEIGLIAGTLKTVPPLEQIGNAAEVAA